MRTIALLMIFFALCALGTELSGIRAELREANRIADRPTSAAK